MKVLEYAVYGAAILGIAVPVLGSWNEVLEILRQGDLSWDVRLVKIVVGYGSMKGALSGAYLGFANAVARNSGTAN